METFQSSISASQTPCPIKQPRNASDSVDRLLGQYELEQLRELGCDQFQGFYRSAAVLPSEIEKFLQPASEVAQHPDQRMFMETQSKLAAFKRP